MRRASLVAAFLLLASPSHSATYYIDSAVANNAGAATKLDPWRQSPGMVGFNGTYTHGAGDVFVFKGGTTWDNGSLPLAIANSGGVGNPDIYTVDATWFAGGGYTPPLFDAQVTDTHGIAPNGNNITVNGITVANIKAVAFGDFSIEGTGDNVTISNCVVRGWRNIDNTLQDHKWGGINIGNNWTVDNCTISGDNTIGGVNGVGIRGSLVTGAVLRNNHISDVPNGMVLAGFANASIYGNTIHDLHGSAAETTHENAIVCTTCDNVDIYQNEVYNQPSTVPMGFYFGVTGGGTSSNIRYWNNLFHDMGDVQCLALESVQHGLIANNTIVTGSLGIRLHGTPVCDNILVENNIVKTLDANGISIEGGTHTIDYNLYLGSGGAGGIVWGDRTLAQSIAAGFDAHSVNADPILDAGRKPAINSPAIDAGATIASVTTDYAGTARPQGAAYDIGAYEYLVAAPDPTPTLPPSLYRGSIRGNAR